MSFRVDVAVAANDGKLEALWRSLQARGPQSPFLSWPWISTWLQFVSDYRKPWLMQILRDQTPVAAGLWVERRFWRRRVVPVSSIALHVTGAEHFDCLCIEHNGLQAAPSDQAPCLDAALKHLFHTHRGLDEIRLDGVPAALADDLQAGGWVLREASRQAARFVDLRAVRAQGGDFVAGLGARTRANVRRTERSLQRRCGDIQLQIAGSALQALEFLEELKVLHERHWHERGGGAFGRGLFTEFHRTLVHRHHDSRVPQLLRLCAGESTVAVVYCLVQGGNVCFYQSGINYTVASKDDSPGVYTQARVIAHYAAGGFERYDMLVGDSDYKRVLAPESETLWWGRVQRRSLKLAAERRLEDAVRRLRPGPVESEAG